MVGELARAIRGSAKPQLVVGVAHGGVFVGGALARALGCEFVPVRITRRSRDTAPRAGPRGPKMLGQMPRELKGKRVLIVDDVAASGDTLELARTLARKAGARQVLTAVLLEREGGYTPDWSALESDELVIFPWDYQPLVEDARFEGKPG